jgi:hypothetical protein
MKLTASQIALIDETLVLNGLTYDEIKLEVTDHIASEIEFVMEENTLSFEESTQMVFKKWDAQLKPASHKLWLGSGVSVPKIILDKLIIETKKELYVVSSIALVVTVALVGINSFFTNPIFIRGAINSLQITAVTGAILLVISKLFTLKSKIKTTYLFLFQRNFYLLLILGFGIGIGIYPILPSNKSTEIRVLSLIFTLFYLIMIYNSLRIFYKHFQLLKKLAH